MIEIRFKSRPSSTQYFLVVTHCMVFLLFMIGSAIAAEAPHPLPSKSAAPAKLSVDAKDGSVKEKQIVELDKSLKNIIEENERLIKQNQELAGQVSRIQTENEVAQNKYSDLQKEHADLTQSIRTVKNDNRKYSQEVKRLESDLQELEGREKEYSSKAKDLQDQLVKQSQPSENDASAASSSTPSVTNDQVVSRESKTTDLLSKIDAFNEANENLKMDSAKAHYNMGNIYFEKGEYELAAREYYQAVTLMPNDPDAHFNLALISSDYLQDFDTALKHFQMYLYLNPKAQDASFVESKILEANMHIQGRVDSPLDKDFP